MATASAVPTVVAIDFSYFSLRRITSPQDAEYDREVYCGTALASNFLPFSTDANVREYMLDTEGKKKRVPTIVHKAMRATLNDNPANFCILNGGIVLVARGITVNDKTKTANLLRPSIINGSQTQGVLKDFYAQHTADGKEAPPIYVKYEIIVTQDEELIGETSISRNLQDNVLQISIVGRLNQLDELEAAFQKTKPGAKLRKSETDQADDFIFTEKLLQVITALIPDNLWPIENEAEDPNKVFTYSMKSKCLKIFQNLYLVVHDKKTPPRLKDQDLYQFYLDIAPEAWDLYQKWKTNQAFYGTKLHCLERQGRKIEEVPDGLIFPILASLSAFAVKRHGKWTISPPEQFSERELIGVATRVYQDIAKRNVNFMGKSKPCYSTLKVITSIYRRLTDM